MSQGFPLVLSLQFLNEKSFSSFLTGPFRYWKATMNSPHNLLFSERRELSGNLTTSLEGDGQKHFPGIIFQLSSPYSLSCSENMWTHRKD